MRTMMERLAIGTVVLAGLIVLQTDAVSVVEGLEGNLAELSAMPLASRLANEAAELRIKANGKLRQLARLKKKGHSQEELGEGIEDLKGLSPQLQSTIAKLVG